MTPRPTIAPGQVWRRPSGLHVLVTEVDYLYAELTPLTRHGSYWRRSPRESRSSKLLSAIGGRGWELVAESVRDPREAA